MKIMTFKAIIKLCTFYNLKVNEKLTLICTTWNHYLKKKEVNMKLTYAMDSDHFDIQWLLFGYRNKGHVIQDIFILLSTKGVMWKFCDIT